MQSHSEIRVTLSDDLLDVLQAQARLLRVIASLVCDTIDTAAVPELIPVRVNA